MIRFSDEKASFVFLFFGILLSIFGMRGDRILLILGGQVRPDKIHLLFFSLFLVFLSTMIASLLYGLTTIAPPLESSAASPGHRRLDWYHEVLRYPVEEYRARLRALDEEAVVEEMGHKLYAAKAIERSEFDRINPCLQMAVGSFIAWVILILMTVTL